MAPFESREVVRRLSTRLKMRHLILLLQIQEHGSLTRVAEHMASSQPAITNALTELESMFGAPLFDRSVRGMTPTTLGKVVLARAKAMIRDLDHLVRDMEAVTSGHTAHLHIGVTPFIAGKLVSKAMQRVQSDAAPRPTVTLHEGTSDELLSQLRDHSLDIVLGRASVVADPERITFEVLYHQQPRLIASRRLAGQLARHRLDWRKLVNLDWILGAPNTAIREQVRDIFLNAGLMPPPPIVESPSSKLIGEMIAVSENAVSIVPADIAEELVRIAGAAIVPYSFTWMLPPIAMYTRSDSMPRAADRVFAEALRQVCREAYPEPASG